MIKWLMMNKKIESLVATVFYAGYFPVASGTIGSLLGMLLYYFVRDNAILCLVLGIVMFALGLLSSDSYEKRVKKNDPHEVVIDEFASVFIVYLFIPFSWDIFIVGFFIYRLFDITKPPPIKSLEKLPGGLGIMLDDIFAAVYTNLILRLLIYSNILG